MAEVEYRDAEQTLGVKHGTPINTMIRNHWTNRDDKPIRLRQMCFQNSCVDSIDNRSFKTSLRDFTRPLKICIPFSLCHLQRMTLSARFFKVNIRMTSSIFLLMVFDLAELDWLVYIISY